jgi:16S rRNA processing protein RimM
VRVIVGRVARAHGLGGEVAVEVRTDDPDTRLAVGSVLATDPAGAGPLTVAATRRHSGRLLVCFAGVTDRSSAEQLRGTVLLAEVDPAERPADPAEFYDHQLRGLDVVTTEGQPVGELADVLHLPAQDVLVVRRAGGREMLIPFVAALVPGVDLAAGRLVVDPPPGLLDLDREP